MQKLTPQPKVMITAALTGSLTTRKQCPHLPYTPKEIADEAVRSYEAGAAMVHVHVREDDGTPSWRPELFEEVAALTRSRCPVLLNFSTGGTGQTIQERTANLPKTRPDMAALNMGSMNYALWSSRQKKFLMSGVFLNPFQEIEWLLGQMNDLGIVPEMECFDAGHVCNAEPFLESGLLKEPLHYSLILGVTGGIKATPATLRSMVDLLPENAHWQLIGISREQWPLVDLSLEMGGHIRVGLEDNFYTPDGAMAKSNAELVEVAVKKVRSRGQKVATVDEARAIVKQGHE
ncbi:MAG: 3-keto-5-aminohexanoate cleavage protein [Bdellovibrionales bacterium]|nr:3-keto-5-aminohexanoate cleavage protein [Bdellovibrionales bacterium]